MSTTPSIKTLTLTACLLLSACAGARLPVDRSDAALNLDDALGRSVREARHAQTANPSAGREAALPADVAARRGLQRLEAQERGAAGAGGRERSESLIGGSGAGIGSGTGSR